LKHVVRVDVIILRFVSDFYSDNENKYLNFTENNHLRNLGADICIILKWITRIVSEGSPAPAVLKLDQVVIFCTSDTITKREIS
jgi:hypothetical protein